MSQKLFASFYDRLQSPRICQPPSLQHRATYGLVQCQSQIFFVQRLNSSYYSFHCDIPEQNSSLYNLTIPYCIFTMPTYIPHNATLTFDFAEPSCNISFYCRSTHINSDAQNNLTTTANRKYIKISPSDSRFKFFCPYLSAMANQQRVRFAILGDSKLRSPHAYVSRADMNSPPPACLTLTEDASHDEGTDNDDAASNIDPPSSLLKSEPLYIPTAEENEIHGWWGPLSPRTTTAAGDLTGVQAPEPSHKRELWLPTIRQVINFFAGRRDATRSRPHNLSVATTSTADLSRTPNRQEELPCPTDPIWIPGQEPSWEDAWYADDLWGDIYPAPSHPTTGYAWVEEDVFVPEIVQRGFHVPSRQSDESSPRLPPARIFVNEPASNPAGKGETPPDIYGENTGSVCKRICKRRELRSLQLQSASAGGMHREA
jgi:hypothetical protein